MLMTGRTIPTTTITKLRLHKFNGIGALSDPLIRKRGPNFFNSLRVQVKFHSMVSKSLKAWMDSPALTSIVTTVAEIAYQALTHASTSWIYPSTRVTNNCARLSTRLWRQAASTSVSPKVSLLFQRLIIKSQVDHQPKASYLACSWRTVSSQHNLVWSKKQRLGWTMMTMCAGADCFFVMKP